MRLFLAFAAVTLWTGSVAGQEYPARPVNIVVPAAAGGPTDTISRITAQAMSKVLGQQITIENAGGAGGTIGTGRVVRAEPDGYTLLIYHVGLATAATLYRKLPYDTKSAFAAVGLLTDAPMTIIGRSDLPPDSLGELVARLDRQLRISLVLAREDAGPNSERVMVRCRSAPAAAFHPHPDGLTLRY
jgi:tripartite-type tricarboxylate transporter receptor subunit TctC